MSIGQKAWSHRDSTISVVSCTMSRVIGKPHEGDKISLDGNIKTFGCGKHTNGLMFSLSVVSDYLQLHRLQYARLPYPLPIPGAFSNSSAWSQWCHSTISSSFIPFSSCLQKDLNVKDMKRYLQYWDELLHSSMRKRNDKTF